ncbi:hypothetical protein CEE45_01455 [Candidatus Heimdallarchaeota archaeon B3_Heim]|nr:MAG: hypothetical protein CEE45_01455 [Candidatus Heimdallarchaeota archaeon B3_Heim]
MNRGSTSKSGLGKIILLIALGIVVVLLWNILENQAKGTSSPIDDIGVLLGKIIASQITIGTLEIPLVGVILLFTLGGILFAGGRK